MSKKQNKKFITPEILRGAVKGAFVKLNPRYMMRNPVMFVVEIGCFITLLLSFFPGLFGDVDAGSLRIYDIIVCVILFITVLFANFAEAVAEGRGKAQAASLKKTQKDTEAHLLHEDGSETIVRSSELKKVDIVMVVAGEVIPGESRLYNTTLLYNPRGDLAARYEKIHMYDVEIENGPSTRESDTKKPGHRIVVADTEFCKVGLSICYDMRFPEMYRIMALQGAKVMFVPANYTLFTGKDHWECILKTRAIENQCYVVAPAQIGKKPAFQAYGRSMIINPWGVTVACAEDRETIIYAEIDPDYVNQIREQLPSLKNRQPGAYVWPAE